MQRALATLLLLVLMAGSAWLAWFGSDHHIIPLDRDDSPVPDYYLSGLTLSHFGPDGQLSRILRAEQMSHVAGEGTDLERPRLTLHAPSGAPWVVTGTRGRLDPAGEVLTLPDDVLITRRATASNRPLRIETRNLRYRPAEGYAETDETVTVTSDGDRIESVGLNAWLTEASRILFRSQVRGHYEP